MREDYTNNRINRDDARRYFWEHGLTYEKVMNQNKIDELVDLLNEHIKKYNENNEHPYYIRVNKTSTKVYEYRHGFLTVFLRGRGGYFSDREMISFNMEKDTNTNNPHWIGFGGEADDNNIQPVLRAFIEWCDWLVKGGEE